MVTESIANILKTLNNPSWFALVIKDFFVVKIPSIGYLLAIYSNALGSWESPLTKSI